MTTRLLHRVRSERGSLLIEMVVTMLFLTVAIGALVSVYTTSFATLRHSGVEGTGTAATNRQIELYNTLPYTSIQLDSSTIPTGSDSYVTAHSADASIPSSTGQITGATVAAGSCTSPATPQPSCATQTLTGADGRTYRIDTYIVSVTPPTTGSRAVKQVTVVARLVKSGTAGPILARAQAAFDACNPPSSINTTC